MRERERERERERAIIVHFQSWLHKVFLHNLADIDTWFQGPLHLLYKSVFHRWCMVRYYSNCTFYILDLKIQNYVLQTKCCHWDKLYQLNLKRSYHCSECTYRVIREAKFSFYLKAWKTLQARKTICWDQIK